MIVLACKQIDYNMGTATKWFCLSAGIVLLITGTAKVWSAFGDAELLRRIDPILDMQFRHLMLVAGILELILAGFCLLRKTETIAIMLVAFFAGSLSMYRLGLWWIGWHRACSCLGNLTEAIHVSPQLADEVMKGILAYLLAGSYGILFHQWLKNRNLKAVDSQAWNRKRD